jgi:hypothetical protein
VQSRTALTLSTNFAGSCPRAAVINSTSGGPACKPCRFPRNVEAKLALRKCPSLPATRLSGGYRSDAGSRSGVSVKAPGRFSVRLQT